MNGFCIKPSTRNPTDAIFHETVNAGDYWLHELKQGEVLRIVDLEGNQAVDTLFFNAADPHDRYSAVDTLRAQGNVYLTVGSKLLAQSGATLVEIVADTCGRHDTLGGACAAESNMIRYALDKRYMHSCRDSFLLALADSFFNKHDTSLSKRDIGHNVNFFMNVPVTPEGGLSFADGISEPGKYVEVQAAMDVIVLVSNCPQLNNPCNAYNPTPVAMLVWSH